MFNSIWKTSGTTTVTLNSNLIFNTVNTTSTAANPLAFGVQVLPLQPPRLEAQPGWLSPSGEYFAVRYDQMQRHGEIATAIINLRYSSMPSIDAQNDLMRMGWVRVDYDLIQPVDIQTTREQRDTLRQLAQLEGDNGWVSVKALIKSFTFKQLKNRTRKK